ncbi:hypothetical protein ACIF8T_18635 [Streptomyces sp. NPDC085946]|uniref:hypothetical protein n=1 Tax=Streptomyces sp. NPDC085946 TaxID=3365744 RepID=UPI0037D8AB91
MRVATRAKTASRRARLGARFAGLGLTTAVALGLAAGPAAAQPGPPSVSGEQPIEVPGNPDFGDLDFDCDLIVQVDPAREGTFGPVTVSDITDEDEGAGQTFDFDVTGDWAVAGVIVKGGPNANLYDYRPNGIGSDENLHAPINPNSGRYYGLSHIDFCLIEDDYNGNDNRTA